MKKGMLFCLIVVCSLVPVHLTHAQSLSITGITPSSPETLNFGEEVTVNFEYSINRRSGFRIFIRPFTSGQLTANYSASGSPNYTSMRGRGSAKFSITKGTVTTVDQLRVQVVASRRGATIFEFFIPVEFTFGQTLSYMPVIPKTLKILPEELKKDFPQDTTTTENKVVKKTVKPDGTIEIYYADGTIMGIISQDERYYINPATGDTTKYLAPMFYSDVQGAHEPADPPGMAASTPTSVDQEWLENLNAWIEYLGYQLLTEIDASLEDEAFKNYQKFEASNSSNIYQQVNLRYTFLEKLRLSDM